MITTDKDILKKVSSKTTVAECGRLSVFPIMQKEIEEAKGLGISAIQVGIAICACIIKSKDKFVKMINPIITKRYDLGRFIGERCLSLPEVVVDTLRHQQVTVSWFDYDAYSDKQAVFVGQEAICIQHEIDHLSGVLITDRVAPQQVKVGRNQSCPCGSGKKFKKCCGR